MMKKKMLLFLLFLVFLISCFFPKLRGEASPDDDRLLRLQALIHRIGSSEFSPAEGERMYPFTYGLRKAEGGEIIRQGEGFVLIRDPLWCMVRRWRDPHTGNPGQRMLIVDRSERKFEAEVRQWPEGSLRQRWNHWTCIRISKPNDESPDLFRCKYNYPGGTEFVIHDSETWPLYKKFFWNEDGLVERINRFAESSVQYRYQGLKVKRIEFLTKETTNTFVEFTYE